MIREHPRRLVADEAVLLRAVRPLQRLSRCAFAGVPFRLQPEVMGGHDDRLTFPEELVLRLIAKGYLVAIQQAAPWPERNVPARPFTVILTQEGERTRNSLLKQSRAVEIDRVAA
ncbi:MAG: hypothetical protein P0Y52_07745 [Candidatus Brevundimonas phytovorans]|nr:hypothetical protein [Brevundimonas sp.]WEK59418.1 MAG: hypothetical protein P0Y52_07745 [Brevundimonas sp.]